MNIVLQCSVMNYMSKWIQPMSTQKKKLPEYMENEIIFNFYKNKNSNDQNCKYDK